MGLADNKLAVKRLFAAIAAEDRATCTNLLSEGARWWIPPSAARSGLERPIHGRETVVDLLLGTGLFQHAPMQHEHLHLIAEGDLVACHQTMRTLTAGGVDYENQYVFIFRFEGARIAEVWEHVDTAYVYDRLAQDAAD